ncbi:MAG: hypothetical protein IH946_04740 [Bacteroidetes bacterium]|nr:hypothetical protein [Bacteroidota bacterium]
MKSDVYLKVVLTVIAIGLTTLIMQNVGLIPTANALPPSSAMDVRVVSWDADYDKIKVIVDKWDADEVVKVDIKKIGSRTLYQDVIKVEIEH